MCAWTAQAKLYLLAFLTERSWQEMFGAISERLIADSGSSCPQSSLEGVILPY